MLRQNRALFDGYGAAIFCRSYSRGAAIRRKIRLILHKQL